jgi:hypothetical protein
VARAEVTGERLDVGGSIIRQGHGLVYNGWAVQARGVKIDQAHYVGGVAIFRPTNVFSAGKSFRTTSQTI